MAAGDRSNQPGTNAGSVVARMPTARWGCRAATIGNAIHVLAGIGDTGFGTANEAYGYSFLFLPLTLK